MRSLLPFLLVLACPLMMVFMMRGMHGHGSKPGPEDHPDAEKSMGVAELRELRDGLEAQMDALNTRIDDIQTVRASVAPRAIQAVAADPERVNT